MNDADSKTVILSTGSLLSIMLPTRPYTHATLNKWINDQVTHSKPRWEIYKQLSRMLKETDDLKGLQALTAAMEAIENLLVERNLYGMQLEKSGRLQEAIQLYEANLTDHFDGSHPYERLRILYQSGNQREDVVRVCNAYIQYGQSDVMLKKKYRETIEKITDPREN